MIRPMTDHAQQPSSSSSSDHIRAAGNHAEVFGYLAVYNVRGRSTNAKRTFEERTKSMRKRSIPKFGVPGTER
jgi:hypothetical protein